MSYFKISLLTPQITNGQMQYLESTISEFFNQSDEFNAKQGKEVETLFTNSNLISLSIIRLPFYFYFSLLFLKYSFITSYII